MKTAYLFPVAAVAHAASALDPQQPLNGDSFHDAKTPIHSNWDNIIDASPFLSFHRDLVQIASVSENEKDVGEFVLDFLAAHNLTVEKQIVTPGTRNTTEKFNVYAYAGGNRYPDVILTSHLDTVPPFIPYSLHAPTGTEGETFDRADLVIAGRGTVDAKASLAAIVFAALETLEENPDASIGLLFDVGEEKSGQGMKHFSDSDLNASPPTFHTVIFGEPTDLKLVAGHKGSLGFRVIADGKAAHSGYPWLGESAISALIPVLAHLDRLEDIPTREGGLLRSEKFGKSTLNIGVVRAGVAANVVPAYAEATISVRLAAGTADDTRAIIARAVQDVTGGEGRVYLDFGDRTAGAPPQHFDADVEGFEVITVNYGTDAAALDIHDEGSQRVKRYLYGPGSIHVAHGEHEAITVGELEDGVRGFKRLISAAL